jgi:signal transduction histidine kinase
MADHERGGGDAEARSVDAKPMSGADTLGRESWLVRAVARAPATVRTKLLLAFAGIVALLVLVAILGLRVLGQSNARISSLGTLQLRAATYQSLQTQAQQLRQLLAIRVAQDPSLNVYVSGADNGLRSGRSWTLVDKTIAAALSQVGPATNESQFGFVPPPADESLLARIRADYRRFSHGIRQIIAADQADAGATKSQPLLTDVIDADTELGALTDQLASRTRSQTDALIAANRSAYASSRDLFIGVGAGTIALALLLGFVLSRSLIGPIRRTESRLAEIAAGDFSAHVEVDNRDELGSLAVNLNRMNDELSRLYGELEAVSRHKSKFLANMSHELRTPLNAIIGFSELIRRQALGELNDDQQACIADVVDAGRHLLSLVNDILDLSKVEAGRMELELSDFSLREVIESGLSLHTERADRAGIALASSFDPHDVTIRADERKVRQVVFNLLSNALKFTPPGGHVDVDARAVDGKVEVAVRDNGPGIDPDDQELIFEEFGQARRGGEQQEGTGLGLPLARKLVELHGGRLWVESAAGAGSTFRFVLPAGS